MSFNEANIVLKVTHNEEDLANRRKELEQIKQTSSQIASLAQHMKQDVHQQGDQLNHVENHIIEAMDNVDKAEQEIKEADKISRTSNKKTIWAIIIIIAIGIILGITLPIVLKDKKK